MKITIDGTEYTVDNVHTGGELPSVELDDGTEWYVAASSEEAGKAARKHWADMAKHDKKEFVCLVGEQNLLAWAMGESAGPGMTQVTSLEEWLDLHLDVPEEHFATYDGNECQVDSADQELIEEIGFTPTVAYRNN